MTEETRTGRATGETDEKSDLRVVLQFFIVPLALVAILVLVFFGMQFVRGRSPDPVATLRSLQSYEGLLSGLVGDLRRWQSGYDLSLLMRAQKDEGAGEFVPELVEAFRAAGREQDVKLRRYLALALGNAADPRAIQPLREGMHDVDAQTRLFSTWGMLRAGDPSVLRDLRSATDDSDAGVRKLAVFALGELGDREAIPLLRGALDDPAVDVGWNAALALARMGDPAATPVLIALLDGDQPPGLVLNAIRGLTILKASEAVEPLRRIVSSSADPEERELARQALAIFNGERAIDRP